MRRSPVQLLTVWLSLLSFLASSTALYTGLVVCDDGHGASRLEWRCEGNQHGTCLGDRDEDCASDSGDHDEHDGGAPSSCDDTPVNPDMLRTRSAAANQVEIQVAAVPVLFAILEPNYDFAPVGLSGRTVPAPAHPPDAVARLRTVILIV